MTEDDARAWVENEYGPSKLAHLERFVSALRAANADQNLISKATESKMWSRHIVDSAQLLRFAPDAQSWLDVGSGAGLPGIVLAIVTGMPILLVEPRRKRVEFLRHVSEMLRLPNVSIEQSTVERLTSGYFESVTARAYASLSSIFASTVRLTDSSTIWVLPKGRTAERELADARESWQGVFHVEQSLTDTDARIIVATDVRKRS